MEGFASLGPAVGQSSRLLFYHSIYTHNIQRTLWRMIPATTTTTKTTPHHHHIPPWYIMFCKCMGLGVYELARFCALTARGLLAMDRFIGKTVKINLRIFVLYQPQLSKFPFWRCICVFGE